MTKQETGHVCTCGDCQIEPFDDRCKYEAMLEPTRLAQVFETVRDAWVEEIGDVHDAWNADDLVRATREGLS